MDILEIKSMDILNYMLVSIHILGIVTLTFYFLKNYRKEKLKPQQKLSRKLISNGSDNVDSTKFSNIQTKAAKSSKALQNNNNNASEKISSERWLASILKGHTDDIQDMDFSNNGKFLASCGEALNNSNRRHQQNYYQHHYHHHHHHLLRNSGRKESASTDSTGSGSDDINTSSNEDSSLTDNKSISKIKKSKLGRNPRQQKIQPKYNRFNQEINNKKKNCSEPTSTQSSLLLDFSPAASPQQKSSFIKYSKISNKNAPKSRDSSTSYNQKVRDYQFENTKILMNQHEKEKRTREPINFISKISKVVIPPLCQHTKLNLKESELIKFLRFYIIDPSLLRIYGYPVESATYEGSIEIFKCLTKPFTHFKTNGTVIGKRSKILCSDIINNFDSLIKPVENKKWQNINNNDYGIDSENTGLLQIQSSDSGNASETSSRASVDSDDTSDNGEEETTTTFYTADGSFQIFNNYCQTIRKQCVRCKKDFLIDDQGEYLTKEKCFYHWGKLQQFYTSNRVYCYQYSCCNDDQLSIGCSNNHLHVWTGVTVGINGPYNDFVRTKTFKFQNNQDPKTNYCSTSNSKVYALDCEMCFTGHGLEVTKITVINCEGNLVYETFVKPKSEVVDYNTRFSGITEKDISSKCKNVKILEQVQQDLLEFINEDTLLIGHALDNDLRALKIIHTNIIDTSITFPHANGFPYRRALKTLTKYYLNRDIQNGIGTGHCSFEDSRACLELMLWRVRKDFRLILEQ